MIKTSILFNKKTHPVSFFRDDTIEVVQQQISRSIDVHPDRLFILVLIKLSENYYSRDPRNWETLFERLSLNGEKTLVETFDTYCKIIRKPAISFESKEFDREEWMQSSLFSKTKEVFSEYRILGVDAVNSFCLPLDFNQISLKIPSTRQPIPELQKLFLSFYGELEIEGFLVKEYEKFEGPYFPLLRSTTPQRLAEAQIRTVEENFKHLNDLISLETPKPTIIRLLKASWKVSLVDTVFGDAVRTRFEQIFYGLTVSQEIPSITMYTSQNEVSRHKFFRNSGEKIPLIDVAMWKHWFTISSPKRDIPTLILYKGSSRDTFDRISLTPTDIIFTSYRNLDNKENLIKLQTKLLEWFKTFDAIIPFIQETDYALCRLELQEVKFEAFYEKALTKYDFSRMNCLSGLFEENLKNKSVFRFLRSDHTHDDLNPRDLKIINLLKEDLHITPQKVQTELKISLQDATTLLNGILKRIEEEPELLRKEHSRNFPKVELKEKSILVAYVNEIERYLTYSNILRYILSNPDSKILDKICPKKVEVSTTFLPSVTANIEDSDIFDFLEKDEEVKVEQEIKVSSGYGYFYDRLKKRITLPQNYPKKCEKNHQPSVFTKEDIAELSGTPYDPQEYSEELILDLPESEAIAVCPEFWCMTDEIPLKKTQLEEFKGSLVCPICKGKIRQFNDNKSDVNEFSVIERKPGYIYPKFPKGEERNIPCCYSTPSKKTLSAPKEDLGKYYIMNEDKVVESLRLAYINKKIFKSIHISENYNLAKSAVNRIHSGMSGYFRVGIERPSIDLPTLLNSSTEVLSPRFLIKKIIKCSFIATWSKISNKYSEEIEKELKLLYPDKNKSALKKISQIISSISEDFENKTLIEIYELEYVAIVLRTDLFKIDIVNQQFNCSFLTPQTKHGNRCIIILQLGDHYDCLCYVSRVGKKLVYKSNVFKEPFTEKTFNELNLLRYKACIAGEYPTFPNIYGELYKKNITDFIVILDPFGRAQAFYKPGKFILPIQNVTFPVERYKTLDGYHQVKDLPSYETTLKNLKEFKFYKFSSNIHDSNGNIVEVLTESGLRIPVKPVRDKGENSEVFQTIQKFEESDLTFGDHSVKDLQLYKKISYNAEIHEFLIFQLSNDLDDYPQLKNVLASPQNNSKKIEHLLYSWFDEITHFMSIKTPIEFLSKIRKPCGQTKNTCNTGHMCAWTENKCRIQIRDEFSKDKVFQKLLGTLIQNSKIRALVLDGRVTPFFSTILYLELPTEIIVTDNGIKQFTRTES
jgi:hypothetical protein